MAEKERALRNRAGRRNPSTLYDAVAGRVGYEGFLTAKRASKYKDTSSTSAAAVPPEEVLFRQRGAPTRYEESDIYSADRHLLPSQRLPDSDLLKTIHAYASDFYGAKHSGDEESDEARKDFRSLDETALLATGILLEEAARKSLGENGDLALLKVAKDEGPISKERKASGR